MDVMDYHSVSMVSTCKEVEKTVNETGWDPTDNRTRTYNVRSYCYGGVQSILIDYTPP